MNSFQRRIIIELSIGVVVLIALGFGTYSFGSSIKRDSASIAQLYQELAQRSAAIDNLAKLKAEYDGKAKNYFAALYNRVPVKDQLINLPRDFRFVASPLGIQYGFSFGDESPGNETSLGSVKFSLNLSGAMGKLLLFVKSLDQFRYLNTLDNITLTSQDQSNYQMIVGGRVFFR